MIPREQNDTLYQLRVSIMKEAAELHQDYLTAVRGLVASLLAGHSRYMQPAKTIRRDQDQTLARLGAALTYINQHYMEDITISRLNAASGTSKSTLQRDMIDFTGMVPMQYIHYLRMNRATVLLMRRMPVAEVAFSVGYNLIGIF